MSVAGKQIKSKDDLKLEFLNLQKDGYLIASSDWYLVWGLMLEN